jgi:hypothetical protein
MPTKSPPIYWIIGAGRFGRRACERLRAKTPAAAIHVVDRRSVSGIPRGVDRTVAEGLRFLDTRIETRPAAWIVPAVPIHLAYEWLAVRLARDADFRPQAVPATLRTKLPNACSGREGQVYVSNADFICPADCPEPGGICTATGLPRPRSMHAHLAGLVYEDFRSLVVRSHQLAPGVGGYRASTLIHLRQSLQARRGRFLLSTACKCHGVMNAFELADMR